MLIDTFLFSEPHEDDLLYLKLKLQDSQVDYFVLQESAHTLQGKKKGLSAQDVVSQDRFAPYRHKIHIVSSDLLVAEGNKTENAHFTRERWQRSLCTEALLHIATHDGNTHVLVSDVDEMVDFTCPVRTESFWDCINKSPQHAWIGRMRYWYDYDNRCFLPTIRIPVVRYHPNTITQMLENVRYVNAPDINYPHNTFDAGEDPIAFEYSYVYRSLQDLWRKKCTYAHNGFTMDSLEEGLKLNAWPRPPERGEGRSEYDFFEKVELTEQNSPQYVRENLESLRTGLVDPNYKENRKSE
jgi:hypothetical protein